MNAKLTNGEMYNRLSTEEKENFRTIYASHPLSEYIDWQAYYESTGGNALDFVKCISEYKDSDGKRVFFLKQITEDNLDYRLIFVCEDNIFLKVPDAENE